MFPSLGFPEMVVIGVIGVLLFGKRLPEVGRSLGKGIIEFKKGLRGIEDEIDSATRESTIRRPMSVPAPDESSAVPRFEAPTAAPVAVPAAPPAADAPAFQD